MKKISTIILACCCLVILVANSDKANAQSLQIVGETVRNFTAPCTELAEYRIRVKNISSGPVKVRVHREIISRKDSQEVYFCWVNCYTSAVDDSPKPGSSEKTPEIPAGKDTSLFVAYVEPRFYDPNTEKLIANVEGLSEVRYHFYNEEDMSDEATVLINTTISCATGVNENEGRKTVSTLIIPNPANEKVMISFAETLPFTSGTIQLFDALGKVCAEIPVSNHEQQIQVSTSTLTPGIYTFTVISDKGVVYTQGSFAVAR